MNSNITLALNGKNETTRILIINTKKSNAKQTVFIPFECFVMLPPLKRIDRMKIKLVKIKKDDHENWKGTWYKTGDFHFVTETIAPHIACRYRAVDVAGGIMESDCELQKGITAWWKCFKKTFFKGKLGLVT